MTTAFKYKQGERVRCNGVICTITSIASDGRLNIRPIVGNWKDTVDASDVTPVGTMTHSFTPPPEYAPDDEPARFIDDDDGEPETPAQAVAEGVADIAAGRSREITSARDLLDDAPPANIAPGEDRSSQAQNETAVRDLLPHPLNRAIYGDEDISALVDQIVQSNWIKPLVVNSVTRTIISGHRRWLAAKQLGLSRVPVEYRTFTGETEELEALLLENASRDKTPEQKVREAEYWGRVEGEKAKARQLANLKEGVVKPVVANLPQRETGKTREKVAVKVGMKPRTYEKAKKVVAAADELAVRGKADEAQALLETLNHKSVDAAYKRAQQPVREAERRERARMLPEGVYSVIYADPPWEYRNSGTSNAAANHYPTMATADVCRLLDAIRVQPAEKGVLFLWATNPLLEDAFEVVRAWGFEYKSNRVWVKDRNAGGFYVLGQHELLLIAVRGENWHPKTYFSSVIEAAAVEHSRKPNLYADIEAMYPDQRYLELFARDNEPRENWTFWGDQAND